VRAFWRICFTTSPARHDRSSPHARRRSAPSGSRRAPDRRLRGTARDLADADVLDAAHGRDPRPRVLHRPTQLRELSLVEAHEAHGDEVDGDGIGPGDHGAERDVRRRQRSLALAGEDAVDDRQHGPHRRRRVEMEPRPVAVIEAAIEVAAHPPGRAVAVPVAAADELIAARGGLDAAVGAEQAAEQAAGEQGPRDLGRAAAQAIDEAALGELVAALADGAEAVVGQPVLVAVDADEVLEGQRHAGLLVGLQLGEVDDEVGGQHGLGEEIGVAAAAVLRRRRAGIVVGAAEAVRVEARAREEALVAEVDGAVAGGIAGQALSVDDDAVLEDDGLAAQVDDLELAAEDLVVVVDDGVEARDGADLLEVAVHLGCFGDGDAAVGTGGEEGVVGDGAEDRAVGDDALDGSAAAVRGGVPVPDQVGLEDDALAGADERADRVPVGGAEARGVETEAMQGGADRGVDLVDGAALGGALPEQSLELGVVPCPGPTARRARRIPAGNGRARRGSSNHSAGFS
jgi:hypothetical protein